MAEIPRQLPADGAASRPVAPIARQIEHAGSRRSLLRQIARDRWMMVGLVIVAVIAALAILAPLLPLPDPDATEPARRLAAPGELGYALGSDQLGRDILSRIVWGGRTSLAIGFVSAGPALVLGRALGLPTALVAASLNVGWMITETAGLSFIGLGAQPPTADWGTMLADGRAVITVAYHVGTLPGIAILALVIGTNLIGEGLRDALDPRFRG